MYFQWACTPGKSPIWTDLLSHRMRKTPEYLRYLIIQARKMDQKCIKKLYTYLYMETVTLNQIWLTVALVPSFIFARILQF